MRTAANLDPARLRTVHLATESDIFKALYFDRQRLALRPNLTFVDASGLIVFETNDVGLKGDALDPPRKLAVVWGDSVVFSSGRGWPCLLDRFAPGYQFLNGGLDGDPYSNILRRASEFNRQHPVALNLLMLGWHPFVPPGMARQPSPDWLGLWRRPPGAVRRPPSGNENIRAGLTSFLERTPNTVVLTMPTALNAGIVERDLSPYFADGDHETVFAFLGSNIPYQVEGQRWGFEHILERNAIAREVCAKLGVRIVDLFTALDSAREADFREHFVDMVHLRPRSYPRVTQIIYDQINDLLV